MNKLRPIAISGAPISNVSYGDLIFGYESASDEYFGAPRSCELKVVKGVEDEIAAMGINLY